MHSFFSFTFLFNMLYFIYFLCLFMTSLMTWNVYHFKPAGGDRAVGQAWFLFFLALAFSLATIGLFILMSRKSLFSWFTAGGNFKTLGLIVFCISFIVAVFFSGMFKIEWYEGSGFPYVLRWLSLAYAYLWIPLCVLVPFYLIIRQGPESAMQIPWIRIPLYFGMAISILYSVLTLYGWTVDGLKRQAAIQQENKATVDKYHQQALDEIRDYPSDNPIQGLLSHSYIARPEDIHKAALSKIQERPDWEQQILDVLKNRESYLEAYYYLCGNPIHQPALFKAPLQQSIVSLAVDVGEDLKETSNFQDWILDHYHIPLMLQSIDLHYPGEASDFRKQVERLQEAIRNNTPPEAKKIRFTASLALDDWVKKHF